MSLKDYLLPVGLEKPEGNFLDDDQTFSRNIRIHTPSQAIPDDLSEYDLIIIGIPEDRDSFKSGAAEAPDKIREKLFQLKKVRGNLKILDAGNLCKGNSLADTYAAFSYVFEKINKIGVPILALGGTQNLLSGILKYLNQRKKKFNLTTIDNRLDFNYLSEGVHVLNYLNEFLHSPNLFQFSNLGHQLHFIDGESVEFLLEKGHQTIGIGQLKNNLMATEPYLRDSHYISLDMSAVKQSDAPGSMFPTPNGFYGEEVCQLARYAGMGHALELFGVFNILPENDILSQTTHLAAQIIWYCIDGMAFRQEEHPFQTPKNFKEFIVKVSATDNQLKFYKSYKTDRWWMAVPHESDTYYISCSPSDYGDACNNEIPERWWRVYQRFN